LIDVFTTKPVHQTSNRHIQAIMNNLKLSSYFRSFGCKEIFILYRRRDFWDWSI